MLHSIDFVWRRSWKLESGAAIFWRKITTCYTKMNQSSVSVHEATTYWTSYCTCLTLWTPSDSDDVIVGRCLWFRNITSATVSILWQRTLWLNFRSCELFLSNSTNNDAYDNLFGCLSCIASSRTKARFPLPELTALVNGPSWRVTGFHYPSTRAVLTGARFH